MKMRYDKDRRDEYCLTVNEKPEEKRERDLQQE